MLADSISLSDFYFDGFADGQINKISWDGGCHAWVRSCLLYPEHMVIAFISYRCTIHSLCYQFAMYFYPLLGIVEFLVLFYDLECHILEF